MIPVDYKELRRLIELRYEMAMNLARDERDSGMRSLEVIWTLASKKTAEDGVQLRRGDLVQAVRSGTNMFDLDAEFDAGDIEERVREINPSLMARSSRKSISTALRRMCREGEIVQMREGRGTKSATYKRIHNRKEVSDGNGQR